MSTIAHDTAGNDRVPVGPGLSMFDPMFIGINEFGEHVTLDVVYHNLLIGGLPGGGKSGLVNTVTGTAALCDNTRLVCLDAKWVELGPWEPICDAFIGDDIDQGIRVMRRLLTVARNRYRWLLSQRRRKVVRTDGLSTILTVVDELAMFTRILDTKEKREEFETLLTGLVALGRACAMPVVGASQRTSAKVIDPNLRDLFGYRCAFYCTTPGSSEVILGTGWEERGYNAMDINPDNPGEAFLLANKGNPRRIKVSWLSDDQIYAISDYVAWTRRPGNKTPKAPPRDLTPIEWEMAA
ncbi:FtsK/SpoIIIE domain-containing protein [Actinoplanes sp. NPDC000266]